MQVAEFIAHDPEFGSSFQMDHRFPLVRLRELRRELVISLVGTPCSEARDIIREIAEVQQAIKAIEAVIVE